MKEDDIKILKKDAVSKKLKEITKKKIDDLKQLKKQEEINGKRSNASERQKKRRKKISDAGLTYLRIIGHKSDSEKISNYAKKLYVESGYKLED